MVKRLKTLVAMQLNNKINFPRDFMGMVIYVVLRIILLGIVFAVTYFLLVYFQSIVAMKVDTRFLLCIVGVLEIIAIIGNTSLLNRELYLARDNTILFSLPVKHDEVFLSKLIVFCIDDLIKSFFLLAPIFGAYGLFTALSATYISVSVLLILLLPVFAVLSGAVLSIGIIYLHRFLKRYSLANLAFFLLVTAAVFAFALYLLSLLPSEIRILAQYRSFMQWVYQVMTAFSAYLIVMKNMLNILAGIAGIWDYVIVFGSLAFLVLLTVYMARPLYFRVTSHLSESAGARVVATENRPRGKFATFFFKELKMLVRDSNRLTGYVISLLSFPIILYIINRVFGAIRTSEMGDQLVVVFNLITGLMLITASNSGMASAVTSEGLEFAVLKTAPGSIQKIAWAKLLINLVCTTVAILIGYTVVGLTTRIPFATIAMLIVIFIAVSFAHILWSFQLDILKPYFNAYIITGNMNNNKNVGRSVFIGLGLSLAFAGIAIFFFLNGDVSTGGAWLRLILCAIGLLAFRFILFVVNLRVYFKRIEL